MALAQQPRLLLLDEPTQGLSVEETEQAVTTLAGLLADGAMTVLLVEHDMEVVFRLAHMITVLHRGAVIADGTPDQSDTEIPQHAKVQVGPFRSANQLHRWLHRGGTQVAARISVMFRDAQLVQPPHDVEPAIETRQPRVTANRQCHLPS